MARRYLALAAAIAMVVGHARTKRRRRAIVIQSASPFRHPKLQETTLMNRILLAAVIATVVPMADALAQDHAHQNNEDRQRQTAQVPLYDNLGNHHYEITTEVPLAQQYFDQGLRLYYAFNHAEAIRSFKEAQRLDPTCAMCWWGEALAWGPNINLPMDSAAGAAANLAIPQAMALRHHGNAREQAMIEALSQRYGPDPIANRLRYDSAYADAMEAVATEYPRDIEAAVLFSESLMDLRPWDYWTEDGQEQPGMRKAFEHLDRALRRNAQHPGACHFFIHAVEKIHPDRAVACAERLANLMPGAGHLVHMPGHIYIRVGRYLDAISVNEHAVHADETYIQDQRPGVGVYIAGYYPHNYDFMAFAASMIGRAEQTIMAADRVAEVIPSDLMGAPGMTFLQHYGTRFLQARVRFGRWDELLETTAPHEDLVHARAMWDYARGRALAATGRAEEAKTHLAQLRAASEDPRLAGVTIEPNTSPNILRIATHVLAGWIAAEQGQFNEAIEALNEAARNENGLLYGEPPEWTVPVRHDLGAILLKAGRFAEAERVFRKDLERFPDNGWSLFGLSEALKGLGRTAEASRAAEKFRSVWEGDEIVPTSETG